MLFLQTTTSKSTRHITTCLYLLLLVLDTSISRPKFSFRMLVENILVIFAAKLVAGSAIGTSPQVVDLDATALLQGNGCAAAGVANGQCGRYYRATGCKDQIGAVGSGVCPL